MYKKDLAKYINDNIVENTEGNITADMMSKILGKLDKVKSQDSIVVGKAVPLGAMPYLWYYNSCAVLNLRTKDTTIKVQFTDEEDGTTHDVFTQERVNNGICCVRNTGEDYRLFRVISYDSNTKILTVERKVLTTKGSSKIPTICEGVYIEESGKIICERNVPIVDDITRQNLENKNTWGGGDHTSGYCVRYLEYRTRNRNSEVEKNRHFWRFGKSCRKHFLVTAWVRRKAKNRWRSVNGVILSAFHNTHRS